jgi:hypothetical protein
MAHPADTTHEPEWWQGPDAPPNASRETIVRAYHRLALELHSDDGRESRRFER